MTRRKGETFREWCERNPDAYAAWKERVRMIPKDDPRRERQRSAARNWKARNRLRMVGGVRLSRASDPPELIAIAECIQETKALLKETK